MEIAAALELADDGRFRYAFSYGALDEEAQGTWRFTGREVHLHSIDNGPGSPAFADLALAYENGELLVDRYDRRLRFRRVGSKCAAGK